MCGLVGIIGEENPALIRKMMTAISHRGPDGEGIYIGPGVSMGHRRLSIIDLERGSQPIISNDGRFAIVFNGEIYNHKDLRKDLEKAGLTFHTNVDTEVILQGFIREGPGFVKKLRGMFAFAIWDARDKTCFIARDQMGIKPLYYASFDGRFYFASEIKGILVDQRVPRKCDLKAMDAFMTFLKFPVDLTAFENIRQLEAGHYLIVGPEGVRREQYYEIAFPKPSYSGRIREEDVIEAVIEKSRETVNAHLMSDVPLGSFLSGGVDSSLVTALMAEFSQEPVKTFSLVHKGDSKWLDESPYIHKLVSYIGAQHLEIESDMNWYQEVPALITCFDQPCTTALNSFMISRLAAKHVKVVLTGTGGDECFAGYGRYELATAAGYGKGMVRSWLKMLRDRFHGLKASSPELALASAFYLRKVMHDVRAKEACYSPAFWAAIRVEDTRAIFDRFFMRPDLPDDLARCLFTDQKLYLIDNLHNNLDKVSMAHGLEARVPFCDRIYVEFANSLPSSLKMKGGELKHLLKAAAARLVPKDIIYRQKRGFGIPLRTWMRGPFAQQVRRVLRKEVVEKRNLFQWPHIEKLLALSTSGKADHSMKIWMCLVVELWFRMYIDSPSLGTVPSFEDLVA